MASGKKPLVVVTRKLPDSVETRMCELFDTRLNLDDKPMSQAELAEAVKVADVLVPTVTDQIDARGAQPVRANGSSSSPISATASTISTCHRRCSAASPSPTRPAC